MSQRLSMQMTHCLSGKCSNCVPCFQGYTSSAGETVASEKALKSAALTSQQFLWLPCSKFETQVVVLLLSFAVKRHKKKQIHTQEKSFALLAFSFLHADIQMLGTIRSFMENLKTKTKQMQNTCTNFSLVVVLY